MKISSMTLRNIKCLEELDINFKSKTTDDILQVCALVGANGAGKTTILQSIVSMFTLIDPEYKGTIFDSKVIRSGNEKASIDIKLDFNDSELDEFNFKRGYFTGVSSEYTQFKDLNYNEQNSNADIIYPSELGIDEYTKYPLTQQDLDEFIEFLENKQSDNIDDVYWSHFKTLLKKSNIKGMEQIEGYERLLDYIKAPNKCLVMYFDAFRYITQEQPGFPNYKEINANSKSCSLKSTVINNTISRRYYNLKQWLINLDFSNIKDKNDIHNKSVYDFLIKTFNVLFDELEYTGIDKNGNILFKEKNGGNLIDLNMLSDGFKSVFLIVGEIIERLSFAYHTDIEKDKEFYEGEAIILIDEVDCHMHPKWQRKFMPALKTLFPNCQFIVTTHSPFILDTLQPYEIVKIGERNIV